MSHPWMYVIEEPKRIELLRDFGVSEEVIALGSGEALPDPVFEYYCNKPKRAIKDQESTNAQPMAAIFESRYNEGYACGKWDGEAAFVYINKKIPDDVTVFGDSEQCLLRALFEEIVDSGFHTRDDIERAAAAVGFEFLPDTFAFIYSERERKMKGERQRDMKAYHDRRLAYIRGEFRPGQLNPGV